MVEAVLRAAGPYSLRLTARAERPGRRASATGAGPRPASSRTAASSCAPRASRQSKRRASCSHSTTTRASSTAASAHDPLLGPTVRRLRGMRTRAQADRDARSRSARSAASSSRRAARSQIERTIIRACGRIRRPRESLARLSPARLTACGLAASRAATLTRLARTIDLEGLRGRRRRARATRARAGRRPVDGRRRRAPGARPLRRRARGRPRPRQAPRVAPRTLARAGRDGGAPRPVRRVAGPREHLPARTGSSAGSCRARAWIAPGSYASAARRAA